MAIRESLTPDEVAAAHDKNATINVAEAISRLLNGPNIVAIASFDSSGELETDAAVIHAKRATASAFSTFDTYWQSMETGKPTLSRRASLA